MKADTFEQEQLCENGGARNLLFGRHQTPCKILEAVRNFLARSEDMSTTVQKKEDLHMWIKTTGTVEHHSASMKVSVGSPSSTKFCCPLKHLRFEN